MTNFRQRLGWQLVLLLAVGFHGVTAYAAAERNCRAYQGPALPESEVAVLRLNRSRSSLLYLIDGALVSRQVPCNRYRLELLPGEHTIHITYTLSYSYLGPPGGDPATFTFDARAGHVYDMVVERPEMFSWSYTCRIEDAADQSVVVNKPNCEEGKMQAWLDILWAKARCGDMDATLEILQWSGILREHPDPAEAFFWCRLVETTYGWTDPHQCRSGLYDRISDEDAQEVERRLREWRPPDCPPVLH